MTPPARIPTRTQRPVHEVEERGDTVLYDREGSVLIVLNEVAAGIWPLIDGERSVEQLAAEVVAYIPADKERVAADIRVFLQELEHLELVAWSA